VTLLAFAAERRAAVRSAAAAQLLPGRPAPSAGAPCHKCKKKFK